MPTWAWVLLGAVVGGVITYVVLLWYLLHGLTED
jgi:hypothetical protein